VSVGTDRFGTIAELGRAFRDGRLSPVELTASFLAEIERVDTSLHAFIEVLATSALEDARRAAHELQNGLDRGPLHGIPFAIKDLIDVRGVRTTAGSRLLRESPVAVRDATVVSHLRSAGAVLLGKTNLHEFAFGPLSTNPNFGDVANPWDLRCHSGGSSGGSAAAVAAGLCVFSIGTDTTGSIRIPAALCGVVGVKPTFGCVSRDAVIPLSWSLDHVGPITRTVADAALVLRVITNVATASSPSCNVGWPDYAQSTSGDVAGLRIAVLRGLADPVDPEVAAAFDIAISTFVELGMEIEVVSLPSAQHSAGIASAVLFPEALAYHQRNLRERQHEFAADVRDRLAQASLVSGVDYVNGQRARRVLMAEVEDILSRVSAIVCPTEPIVAPRIDEEMVVVGAQSLPKASIVTRCTRLFNLTGHPAITVPCGYSRAGMPIALQLAGAHYGESVLLRVAHAYQSATQWHTRHPDVLPMRRIPTM